MTSGSPDGQRPLRVGAVSYFNTRLLTYGLDEDPRFDVSCAVPSRLPGMLETGLVDVALVPTIDTATAERRWNIVSDACIGCDGATLTVRVFSRVDPSDITVLHVDSESHSSLVMASIIWREKFGRQLTMVPFKVMNDRSGAALSDCQAVLLIGDKVITPPAGLEAYSTQVDLGATWKSLTGLPFVFAVWATPDEHFPPEMAQALGAARDAGVAHAAEIAAQEGPGHGWPIDLARRYLTEYLTFTLTDRHREGMRRFLELARRHKLVAPFKELVGT